MAEGEEAPAHRCRTLDEYLRRLEEHEVEKEQRPSLFDELER